jgi:malate-CoA ligase subunit alpha
MGHAGAIISKAGDSASEKSEIMKSLGITVAPSANDFGTAIKQALS